MEIFTSTYENVVGKTGGQQGDPLEMLVFNLTTLHLWGRTLAKYPQDRTLAYVKLVT